MSLLNKQIRNMTGIKARKDENYACRGCIALDESAKRCRRWGGRCQPDDLKCRFYTYPPSEKTKR